MALSRAHTVGSVQSCCRSDTFEPGLLPEEQQQQRKAERVAISATVALRRNGQIAYRVNISDASPHGCKAEFVERPRVGELVSVKFEGMEALPAQVCWVEGFSVGLEFRNSIHEAVFNLLLSRLR
jgi:hypothetical protein